MKREYIEILSKRILGLVGGLLSVLLIAQGFADGETLNTSVVIWTLITKHFNVINRGLHTKDID